MKKGKIRAIPDEDASLVASSRKGNLTAFEALVRKHQARVFNLAFRILGDYEDAGEIAQDAFVAAWRGLGSFRGEASFSTWLTTITVNLARNRLKQVRGRRFRETRSLDEPVPVCEGCVAFDPPSEAPSAHERMETEEVRQRVQGCINGLEPGFREVLVLRDVEEYSYGEIGEILSLAEGTVKSRLFRARDAVRDCLKRVLGEL
jgi:RNA polymerase sigma-70 factor (ECF subfamily)